MKHNVLILFCLILCLTLIGCTSEVNSETEARRILIQTYSDITDVATSLNKDFVSEQTLKEAKKILENCLVKIESTNDYYEIDTVKDKYDSTLKVYNETLKKLEEF